MTHEGVKDALSVLDGTTAAALSLITGFTPAELDDLGGLAGTN